MVGRARRRGLHALLVFVAACAVDQPARGPAHPADPAAPTGRLAGAPATLRPGVVAYPGLPALRATPVPAHQHHHGP